MPSQALTESSLDVGSKSASLNIKERIDGLKQRAISFILALSSSQCSRDSLSRDRFDSIGCASFLRMNQVTCIGLNKFPQRLDLIRCHLEVYVKMRADVYKYKQLRTSALWPVPAQAHVSCMYACMHVCMCVCMYECTYVCM